MDSDTEYVTLTSTALMLCTCGREQPMLLAKKIDGVQSKSYCDECNPEDTSKEAKADFQRLRVAMRIRQAARAQGFHTGV